MRVTFTFETKHQQQRETHEKRMSGETARLENIFISNSASFRHQSLCTVGSQNIVKSEKTIHKYTDFMHACHKILKLFV